MVLYIYFFIREGRGLLWRLQYYSIFFCISRDLRFFLTYISDFLEQLDGELGGGVPEHVDADGELRLALGGAYEEALDAGEASALDTHLAAYLQAGGVDGDGRVGIAHHALEVDHLVVGDDGEVGSSVVVVARAVHHEVEDELSLAGYGVACVTGAADEEVAGTDAPVDPVAPACAGPLVELALHGDVGLDAVAVVVSEHLLKSVLAGCLGVGGDYGYEPECFFHGY